MDSSSYRIVHDVTPTAEINAQHNFFRGKIQAYEDFLELAADLKDWKEMHRKKRSKE